MQTKNTHRSAYAAQIAEATGAPAEVLPILENILRDEVFHSTLDWQSAAQLRAGAKKAYRIYRADADFYRAAHRLHRASFELMRADSDLREVRDAGKDAKSLAEAERAYEQARSDEAAARALYERAAGR